MLSPPSKISLVSVVLSLGLSAGVVACEQPELRCTLITGNYVARYEVLANKGSCEVISNDVISGAYFLGKVKNGQANADDGGIGLVPWSIRKIFNAAADRAGDTLIDEGEFASSYGRFVRAKPLSQRCTVKRLSEVNFRHGEVPPFDLESVPPSEAPTDQILDRLPADHYRVTWNNVEVQVEPAWLGSYFEGKVTIQRKCGDVTYAVQAVFETVCQENADCRDIAPQKARCNKDLQLSWRSQGTTFGTCELI